MLYPPMSKLLDNVKSRYLMVNVVARRARQISIEAQSLNEPLDEKPVSMAIKEVAEGKLTASLKSDSAVVEHKEEELEEPAEMVYELDSQDYEEEQEEEAPAEEE